jgi:Effector Associated Constant Component 1
VTNSLQLDLDLGAGAGAEELDEATRDLLRELAELDLEAVERPAGEPPPPGARGVEVALLGTLLVTLGQGALGAVSAVLQGWLSRRAGRTVKLTLGSDSVEISGGSAAYQRQLIETFLAERAER